MQRTMEVVDIKGKRIKMMRGKEFIDHLIKEEQEDLDHLIKRVKNEGHYQPGSPHHCFITMMGNCLCGPEVINNMLKYHRDRIKALKGPNPFKDIDKVNWPGLKHTLSNEEIEIQL